MSSQTEGFDEVANKTDFGHFINSNAKPITIAGILVVVGIIAFSLVQNQRKDRRQEEAKTVYQFEKDYLEKLNEKKIEGSEFVKKFKDVSNQDVEASMLMPTALYSSKTLKGQGKPELALEVLEGLYPKITPSSYAFNFISLHLAVLYEDLGKTEKAIEVLEALGKSNVKVLEAKLYLDLGRLYKKVGNKEKASLNFNYVVEKFPNDEMAKLAKFYLKDL